MEYNKHKFVKSADRKVLHKVKKHWVTISIALLGLVGGVTAVHTNVSANANSTADQANHQLNSGQLADRHTALQTNEQSNHSSQYGFNSQNAGRPSAQIVHQANLLHNGILQHAMISNTKSLVSSAAETSGVNSAVSSVSGGSSGSARNSALTSPQIKSVSWGQTQIKFISDGDHGNAGGDVAEVQPGAISDAFNEQNNSDTTYNTGNSGQSSYVVNRYQDALELPFDQNSTNWILKFAPQVTLPKRGGISKDNRTPRPGENSSDFDYEQGAYQTNDYQYLLSSVNRTLWNHFKTMDLTNLDTDNASDLSNMFAGDQALQKVILNSSANPHLINLRGMFANAPQLREIDFNHFGTGQVQNMDSMFMSDVRLNHLDVGSLNTSHVTNLHGAFMSDFALSDVKGLNTWDTSQVTNLVSTFARDLALQKLNLDHWDTSQVTSMAGMFSGDVALRDLDLSNFQTGKVSDLSSMFAGDQRLQKLNLANFDTRNVKAIMPGFPVGGMSFMFNGDNNLQQLTLGSQTALNRPNQNWGAQFFNQNFDVNGHDTTSALQNGQQAPGTYYSAAYYQNVLAYQQYFTDEQALANQALANADVKADPQIRSQVGQEASQISAIVKDDTARLTPASQVAKALDDVNRLASLTSMISDQSSLASNVASSVARANRSASAVQSVDSSIAASYRASVAQSVTVRNRWIASSAARVADQKIAQSMRDSVTQSVSNLNRSLALSAAQSADNQLVASYQSSVAQSVSVSNRKLAVSAARSADQSLVNSMRASVSNSVAVNDQKLAQSAAQSADRQIAESYRASVSNSVAFANHQAAIIAQQSANASLAKSARDSVSASVAVASSQAVAASVSAQSVSQSVSVSNSIRSAELAASASVFRSNINQVNSYDRDAGSYNRQALNDLSRINVSANASLTSLKNNDLNEVADDNQLISEDDGVVNDLVSNYNSAEPSYAIGSAENQLATARDVAQDASLIITDDLTNLKSRASQTASSSSNSSSNRARSSNADYQQSSSSSNPSNSAHRTSSNSASINSNVDHHNSNSVRSAVSNSASSSHANSLRASIVSVIYDALTVANGYAGQVNRAVSNSAVETDPQASAAINYDVKAVNSADQAIMIDQQRPNLDTKLNADYELDQIHSADSNASLTVLGAEQASLNAARAAQSAAENSVRPASSSSAPQPSASPSSIVSSSSLPGSASTAVNHSSENNQSVSSTGFNNSMKSLNAVSSGQAHFVDNRSNRASVNVGSSADIDHSASSSNSSSNQALHSNSSSAVQPSHRKMIRSTNPSASYRTDHSLVGGHGSSSADFNDGSVSNNGSDSNYDSSNPAWRKSGHSVKDTESVNNRVDRANQNHHPGTLPQAGERSPSIAMATALLTLSILMILIRKKRRHDCH